MSHWQANREVCLQSPASRSVDQGLFGFLGPLPGSGDSPPSSVVHPKTRTTPNDRRISASRVHPWFCLKGDVLVFPVGESSSGEDVLPVSWTANTRKSSPHHAKEGSRLGDAPRLLRTLLGRSRTAWLTQSAHIQVSIGTLQRPTGLVWWMWLVAM